MGVLSLAGTALTIVALLAPLASWAEGEPSAVDSLLVRAEEAIAGGDLERGRELCEEALDLSRDAHRAQWTLAVIALEEDDPDEAVKRARKAVDGDEGNVQYRMTLADAYGSKAMQGGLRSMMYGGRYKGELETVLELDPEHIGAHFGLLYYGVYAPGIAGGGMDTAWERAETIAAIDEYYGHLARAVLAKREDDFVRADGEYLAAARVDTTNSEGWYVLGNYYIETERPGLAVEPLERALALAPDDLVTVYQLAKALYQSGADLVAAEAGFREYIASDGRPREPGVASAHWRLGLVLEAQGRHAEAIVEYDTALGLDPEHELAGDAKRALESRVSGAASDEEADERRAGDQ